MKGSIGTILSQLKQYKTAAILTPVFTTLVVVMDVFIPYVTASLIDKGINASDMGNVWKYGGIMILMSCAGLLFGILSGFCGAYSSSGLATNLREAMYSNIQRFAYSDIDKYSTAGLVTRMTTDVSNIQNAFQMALRISVRAPLSMVFSLVMCIFINARLSIIFFIALAFLTVAIFILISHASRLFVKIFKKYDVLNGVVQENVDAIRVVKAYVRENHEISKFDKAALSLYSLNVRAEGLMALNHPAMNIVVYGTTIALCWFGAQFIVGGSLTTGQLTSLLTYVMTILMSLMMLSMIFVQLTMSMASGQRIAQVINEVPDMSDPQNPVREVPDGSIDFKDVYFAYSKGGEYALEDINLHISAGETIGVIGGTGSGKSSLAYLIPRLYDVSKGEVLAGGINVNEYEMEALRQNVAVVLQKSTLFSGTILENLRWGREDASPEDCQEACRLACADEFIEEMPDKYETMIEEGGTNVSGGQRQRLCIARALLKNPKILILDDSTSAVDTATDAKIRASLSVKIPGLTKVIISQRILSIKDADRIIVMDNGKVVAFDAHENLLRDCEIYRDIYEMQASGSEADFDKKEVAA